MNNQEITEEIIDDLKFDVGSKILEQTGIFRTKQYFQTINDVIELIEKGISLESISFGIFDWCGYKKIIVRINEVN